jgi:hypothetical protein
MTIMLTAACLPAAWAEWICNGRVKRSGIVKICRYATRLSRTRAPLDRDILEALQLRGFFFLKISALRSCHPRVLNAQRVLVQFQSSHYYVGEPLHGGALYWRGAMAASNARLPAVCLCGWAVFALAGCDKPARDDMSWAQGALERNGRLQILSVDRQAHAFTVRLKDTGELRIVQADEVVGDLPLPADEATTARAGPIVAAEEAAAAPPSAAAPAEEPAAVAASPADVSAATAKAGPGVIASGPGYSIKSARAEGPGSARASGFAPNDSVARGLPLERRDEPIVCQGARFLRIDSRNLEFEGDAISAQDGCEIHITNSRIAATGVGVSARAANVHIENSSIEGKSGSILASDGAQVYAEASRFRGLSRGLTSESLHDLGGNVWN